MNTYYNCFHVLAMERAATPGNLMETHIVVAAIASGLVGVIVVAMMIYLCCFNPRNKRLSSRTEVRPAESDNIKNDPNGVGDRITPRSKFLLNLHKNRKAKKEFYIT